MSYLEKAIGLALRKHEGQVDKAGQPYILHSLRVMLKMPTATERIIAVLHDIVEDTDVTLPYVRTLFGDDVAEAVDRLTHRRGERYAAYIERIAAGPDSAIHVKLEDLLDNMNLDRLAVVTSDDFARQDKYRAAYRRLRDCQRHRALHCSARAP